MPLSPYAKHPVVRRAVGRPVVGSAAAAVVCGVGSIPRRTTGAWFGFPTIMQDSEAEVFDEQDVRNAIPRTVPGWALPHPSRFTQFRAVVLWDDGVDEDGNFSGWCPLHDDVKDSEATTAEFNFRHGVMRCFGDPSCHPGKRATSLTNVTARMTDGQQ